MYTVGIDLGTTGCKAVLVDETGSIAGQHYIEYPLIVLSAEQLEQDAGLWWSLSCEAVRRAVEASGLPPDSVAGISVASQGISFVLVDNRLEPIGNAYSWLDCRAGNEMEEIGRRYSPAALYHITGLKANPTYLLPKLLWIRSNRPEDYAKTEKILMAHDYLVAKMTGETVTDQTMAGGSMLYDVSARCWSQELLDAFHVEGRLLPELRETGEIAGTLRPAAAACMGLPPGIPVIVGGQDQKVAAFTALADDKTVTLCLGTAGAMEFLADKPVFDPKMRMPLFPYLFKGIWTIEAVVSTAGAALKWLRDTSFKNMEYSAMDRLAEQSEPGSHGVRFYPHFGGATSPHWIPEARGVFSGLNLHVDEKDMIRAVLEGIAFQMKTNLLVGESLCGPCEKLVVFGSGSASPIWCRIFADITGKCITALPSPDATGLGAAGIVFRALGNDTAGNGCFAQNTGRVYEPNPRVTEQYHAIFEEYRRFENRMFGDAAPV